ncbi:MAG: hypothetical protein PUG00_07655 [Clostridiales bacterium]|nr:hypothetical protein [Clostridiales bacterium]
MLEDERQGMSARVITWGATNNRPSYYAVYWRTRDREEGKRRR